MNEPIRPRPVDELEELAAMVRRTFASRFEKAKGSLWTSFGSPDVHTLARWVQSVSTEPDEQLVAWLTTLDNFFADAWCRERHFPIGHLCRHVHRYHQPPQLKPMSLDELKEKRLKMILEGDPYDPKQAAEYSVLATKIKELEEQAEKEARRGNKR